MTSKMTMKDLEHRVFLLENNMVKVLEILKNYEDKFDNVKKVVNNININVPACEKGQYLPENLNSVLVESMGKIKDILNP